MARRSATFRQVDLKRAIAAALQAVLDKGLTVAEEVGSHDGYYRVVTLTGAVVAQSEPEKTLDQWLAQRAHTA